MDPAIAERGGLVTPTPNPSPQGGGGQVANRGEQSGTRQVVMLQRKPGRMGRTLGVSTGWVLRLLLAKRQVAQMTGVAYERIDQEGVHIVVNGERRVVPADTIVICTGQEPNRALYDELIQVAQADRGHGGHQHLSGRVLGEPALQ